MNFTLWINKKYDKNLYTYNILDIMYNIIMEKMDCLGIKIINEDDLIIALSTNVIAGAGVDVYEKEPLPENNKLRFLPNVLLTPHIGYVTAENYQIYYSQMIESLEACVNGKSIRVIE